MNDTLIQLIHQANPWLLKPDTPILEDHFIPRIQAQELLSAEWDKLWLILVGPRQAGKTTLAKFVSKTLIQQKCFSQLLYLNCDLLEIRRWITTPLFIKEAMDEFQLHRPIILIDEAQRLENPGLLLKACADLNLDIKMMATGSSQLELKSKVQEFLTGRHLEVLVLPLSYQEIGKIEESELIYGCYPAIVTSHEKAILLRQIYEDYVTKDIIEILKISKPDIMQKLITLIAHSSGQLVNYSRLAADCQVSIGTIQHYLSILKHTYTVEHVRPFVANKRKEVTTNPVFYFIDNGFRNQSLHNLTNLDTRSDVGLLIQNAVFQELLKFKVQHFYDFTINFWRTLHGAEVDFIIYKNENCVIPVEVKYRTFHQPQISRSFRSFVQAYSPRVGFIITKNFNKKIQVESCEVTLISFSRFLVFLNQLQEALNCF